MSLLEVENITKKFSGVTALDDVGFQVEEGAVHAVIGPNGSGKTTLFNIISGIYKPSSGNVIFNNHRIAGLRPFQVVRRGIARTFQHPRLFKSMTVLEQLTLATHASGFKWTINPKLEQLCRENLEIVGMEDFANVSAQSLPQGQRRLLEIARALCLKPKLLLLDEPHAGLNPVETEKLMDIIRLINQQGITILLVEHEMNVVMTLANNITVLNFGKLLAVGTPAEIQSNPAVIEAYLGSSGRVSVNATE